MPSSTNGPYQSKFFNFLNRQSLNWRDRLETTARHLKVTVEWGVQILLYPAYLLVQAGRMAGRELEQVATRAQLPAAAPAGASSPTMASDGAIEQVLSAIDLSQENEPVAAIQGIASLVDSRRLALVTAENSLLDVLSPEQQKTLLARIRSEVANYWYERRLAQAETQKLPGAIPDLEGERDKVLPPARWFWKVMRWVQRSPVAIAANLFGESRFGVAPEQTSKLNLSAISPSPALVATLDRRVAQLEIAPLDTAKQLFQQLRQQLQAISQQHVQPLVAKAVSAPLPPANPQAPLETADPFALHALILAAVDYFFGQRAGQTGIDGNQTAARKHFRGKGNAAAIAGETRARFSLSEAALETEAPWLSWEDLFAELPAPAVATGATLPTEGPASLPSGLPVPNQSKIPPWERLRQNLQRSQAAKLRKSPPKSANHLTKQEAAGTPTYTPPSPADIVPAIEEPDVLETAFDWLEAEVIPAGYVRHPLEQILEWLDRFVLWLEQLLARLMKGI